ncbi:MAG: aminoglycoside phosphotransferase [Gammaproteobacteria bacterium]|nr:MAG: aminoglycoside phosphotransferase [Gammaproteobacteria bacterium]
MTDIRKDRIYNWLTNDLRMHIESLEPASEDASFRRYFRATSGHNTHIVMDAPPEKEDCRPFIAINIILDRIGVHVPTISELDLDHGFLLLQDLGSTLYLSKLEQDPESVAKLYADAFEALSKIHTRAPRISEIVPNYSRELLMNEMELFREWLLKIHYQLELDPHENEILDQTFTKLADNALEQPQVFVHRDYHSRNLMVTTENSPGIIDFQDAVIGPITYDLVSLLRDCYIAWPYEQVKHWVIQYFSRPEISPLLNGVNINQIIRWFDLMGVQRHLKASGIFARLNHRDGKIGYLKDVPRTLNYILDVLSRHHDFEEFLELFQQKIAPKFI